MSDKFSAIISDTEELRQKLYTTGEKGDFVHLHLHSDFSLKDGIGKPNQYVKQALELKMPAVAITDHGSIGAHPSFFMFCYSSHIKPIVGVEAYLNDRRRDLKGIDAKLDVLNVKVKAIKTFLNHKRVNKKHILAHIDLFREILSSQEIEVDEIAEMDNGELREKVKKYNNKVLQDIKLLDDEKDIIKKNQHIVLLAKNETGRKHITKIISDAAINGFYYKPRTDFEFIKENKEGIIVTSACLAGVISTFVRHDSKENGYKEAYKAAQKYKDTFGDDFYIEIMLLNLDIQYEVNEVLIKIAKDLDIKLIVTNDVHYSGPEGAKAQEISLMLGSKDDGGHQVTMKDKKRLLAIKEILKAVEDDKTNENVRRVYNRFMELDRFEEFRPASRNKDGITFEEISDIVEGKTKFRSVWSFETKDLYFKDRHQLIDAYIDQGHYKYFELEDFVNALNNTLEIANKVESWEWDAKEKLPKIELGNNKSSYEMMVELVKDGFVRKAKDEWYDPDNIYAKRIKTELNVIRRLDLADYFLIVADYIKFAKNHNVLVGAGRGCFLPGINKVKMADRTEKSIDQIKVGDIIANKFHGKSIVEEHFVYDVDEDVIELYFDDWRKCQCTQDHRFFTKNRGEVKAIDLSYEDEIIRHFNFTKLRNKRLFHYIGQVHDLKVSTPDKSYIINDAVVHNSAAGSLVCYLLDITNVDPIPFNLLFERFLSMSRSIAVLDLEVPDKKIKENNTPFDLKINAKVKKWFEENRLIKLEE